MPSLVEMKWAGTDADRKNLTKRYFRSGLEVLAPPEN
jgi:hypothetical protein